MELRRSHDDVNLKFEVGHCLMKSHRVSLESRNAVSGVP